MSLYKGPTGVYEADFRFAGFARLHLSMGARILREAQPRYDAVVRLYREAKGPDAADRLALIDLLRTGKLSLEALESMVRERKPLAPAGVAGAALTVASVPTFDEIRAEYLDWMDAHPKLRPGTWESTSSQLKRFAAFAFDGVRTGDLPFDQITSKRVTAYQTSLIAAGAAANTITGHVSRVGSIFAWMQRREERLAIEERRVAVLIHNPLDREVQYKETTSRDRWLTHEEALRLFAATPAPLLVAPALGLLAGLRIGEVLHLRTHVDIDMAQGTIHIVAKDVGKDMRGRAVVWKPKTRNAERYVPISDDLFPILERHIESWANDDWLMPSELDPGRPFVYGTFLTHFTQIVKDAELITGRKDPRGVVFHTTRHTFASWLVMEGIDLYTVAQLVGDTLQTVEKTYAHLAPDFKKRAIEALKGIIRIPMGQPSGASSATETATETENPT